MSYLGHIKKGVVVFDEPVPLPEGTDVRVEQVAAPPNNFWESLSLDQLAQRQGVSTPASTDEVSGGWPDDELNDGFEDAVANSREQERDQLE